MRILLALALGIMLSACHSASKREEHHGHGDHYEKSGHQCSGECKEGECPMKEKKDCGDCKKGECKLHKDSSYEPEIGKPLKFGKTSVIPVNQHLHLSAAPGGMQDFKAAKKAGVVNVIDLREEAEFDKAKTAKAASNAGLVYSHIPMSKTGEIQKSSIDEVEKLVMENHGSKTWVFCASGNRAGAWFALHLTMGHHNLDIEKAIEIGKKVGLSKEDTIEKVRAFKK